jgi:hypothetical protein
MPQKPDSSIFYSLACINDALQEAAQEKDWGNFIQPLPMPEYKINHNKKAGIYTSELDFGLYNNKSPLFDFILQQIQASSMNDQYRYSVKYYYEYLDLIARHVGSVNRIVEVGPAAHDISYLFSVAMLDLNMELDIVDIDKYNLLQIQQKIAEIFPDKVKQIRFYFGDIPSYIYNNHFDKNLSHLIHYQASINFNDLVRDLAATAYVKQHVFGTIVTNTHLRSHNMRDYAFADIALYAVFGGGLQFHSLGESTTKQSQNENTYYLETDKYEAFYLPYQANQFRYPHPSFKLASFVIEKKELAHV